MLNQVLAFNFDQRVGLHSERVFLNKLSQLAIINAESSVQVYQCDRPEGCYEMTSLNRCRRFVIDRVGYNAQAIEKENTNTPEQKAQKAPFPDRPSKKDTADAHSKSMNKALNRVYVKKEKPVARIVKAIQRVLFINLRCVFPLFRRRYKRRITGD